MEHITNKFWPSIMQNHANIAVRETGPPNYLLERVFSCCQTVQSGLPCWQWKKNGKSLIYRDPLLDINQVFQTSLVRLQWKNKLFQHVPQAIRVTNSQGRRITRVNQLLNAHQSLMFQIHF